MSRSRPPSTLDWRVMERAAQRRGPWITGLPSAAVKVWIAHPEGRDLLGEIPDGVDVQVVSAPDELPADATGVRFWVPPFLFKHDMVGVAAKLPDLRVVQLLSAGADGWVGRLPAGVVLCDARGVHDSSTAEWAMTAILAHLRSGGTHVRGCWAVDLVLGRG